MELEKIIKKLSDKTPTILGIEDFSQYAVLLPLVIEDNQVKVLFEVRSMNLRRQPGEICFPGGRIDPIDKSHKETAIRETTEELGIEPENITNILPMDYMVSPFGTIIYPYVGVITEPNKINPNPDEVGETFTVPLSELKQKGPTIYKMNYKIIPEEGFPFDAIPGGENYNWQARGMDEHFYYHKDKVIWGLTARILNHFLKLVG